MGNPLGGTQSYNYLSGSPGYLVLEHTGPRTCLHLPKTKRHKQPLGALTLAAVTPYACEVTV